MTIFFLITFVTLERTVGFSPFFYCESMHMGRCELTQAVTCMWSLEDTFWVLVFSFHPVGSLGQTQAVQAWQQRPESTLLWKILTRRRCVAFVSVADYGFNCVKCVTFVSAVFV